jgi:hypothetical protein
MNQVHMLESGIWLILKVDLGLTLLCVLETGTLSLGTEVKALQWSQQFLLLAQSERHCNFLS